MNEVERAAAIESLNAKLKHNPRVTRGVSWAGGRKSWQQATTTTDGRDFHLLPKHLQERIRRQEAAERAEMDAWAAAERAKVAAEHPGRQSTRSRMKVLTDQLVAECDRTIRQYGYPVLPPSMTQQIVGESWRLGEPITRAEIEEYTKRTLERAAREHAKVYGHRNEGVALVGGVVN